MKVVENNIIPFPKSGAINLFGLVFVRRKDWEYRSPWYKCKLKNHEAIHIAQMKELLYVFFYILYILEWFWEIVVPPKGAYRWISFEQEAYAHESDEEYLNNRKHFAQWRKSWLSL